MWNICPTHKWYGKKRVAIAFASAALYFSDGAKAKHNVMVMAGIAVGIHTKTASKRRDLCIYAFIYFGKLSSQHFTGTYVTDDKQLFTAIIKLRILNTIHDC